MAAARPRLGVVLTAFGLPSEVWALRQARAFAEVEPVLFAWPPGPGGQAGAPPADLEAHRFDVPFARPVTRRRRLGWKLGLTGAILPPRRDLDALARTLRAARLDGVLCHFAWNAIPVAAALATGPRAADPPVAVQVHGRDVSAFLVNRAYRAALRAALPRLAFLAAVGRFQIETLRPYGPLPPHAVIPCGAPLDRFAGRPVPDRPAGAPLRLVSVGRLSPEKGVMETLAAFRRLAAEVPAEWVCIGDGPLAGPLAEAIAAEPPAGPVRLAGALAPEAVAEALADAHVFVQHSRPAGGWIEGFGVSLTEAGAAGLPRVAADLGGVADQATDGVDALLFAPDDVDAQAAALLRLARDEPLRRRLGAAARETAARFDSTRLARALEGELLAAFAARRAAA